jgi:hypothetical protein
MRDLWWWYYSMVSYFRVFWIWLESARPCDFCLTWLIKLERLPPSCSWKMISLRDRRWSFLKSGSFTSLSFFSASFCLMVIKLCGSWLDAYLNYPVRGEVRSWSSINLRFSLICISLMVDPRFIVDSFSCSRLGELSRWGLVSYITLSYLVPSLFLCVGIIERSIRIWVLDLFSWRCRSKSVSLGSNWYSLLPFIGFCRSLSYFPLPDILNSLITKAGRF